MLLQILENALKEMAIFLYFYKKMFVKYFEKSKSFRTKNSVSWMSQTVWCKNS